MGWCAKRTPLRQPVFVIMGVEQPKLLAAVDGVEGVVDVERDPLRHPPERGAIEIDHGPAHAQQRPLARQVLQPRDGRLRAQRAARRRLIQRHPEHRIEPQAGGVVPVLVSGGDHQQPEADDLGQSMDGLPGRPWIIQAGGQSRRHAKAGLDLAQRQHPGIRGKLATIEPGHHRLAGDG